VLADAAYPDLRPLRKRDELHEFFTAFEEAIGFLKSRDVARSRRSRQALEKAKKGDKDEAVKVLASLKTTLEQSLRTED